MTREDVLAKHAVHWSRNPRTGVISSRKTKVELTTFNREGLHIPYAEVQYYLQHGHYVPAEFIQFVGNKYSRAYDIRK